MDNIKIIKEFIELAYGNYKGLHKSKTELLTLLENQETKKLLKHSFSVSDLVEIENAYIEDANNVLRGDIYTVYGRVSKCWILETDFDNIKCTHN